MKELRKISVSLTQAWSILENINLLPRTTAQQQRVPQTQNEIIKQQELSGELSLSSGGGFIALLSRSLIPKWRMMNADSVPLSPGSVPC